MLLCLVGAPSANAQKNKKAKELKPFREHALNYRNVFDPSTGFFRGRIADGSYGIQALEAHWITNRQIEACRVAMTRKMRRGGKVWITIFPDKPITKKPAETRMGSGKGNPEEWVAVVKPGRIMFEIDGVPEDVAKEALRLAQHKLPIKTKIVSRADQAQEV